MKPRLRQGIPVALTSALFLGLSPILGKLAINLGLPPLIVVAGRTVGAALLLLAALLILNRELLYIHPLGLAGCGLAGLLNGVGSLFYYLALGRIEAALGQLLFSFYPLFVAGLLYLDGFRYSRLTLVRLLMILPAALLMTSPAMANGDWVGMAMMLVAGLLYALHIPVNQRVLYESPAPTVTFYTLLAMALVVVPVAAVFKGPLEAADSGSLLALAGLTMVTFFSRLTLFSGVKSIGGLDTAVIGLGELVVTLFFAHLWLGERLAIAQWAGAAVLTISIGLVLLDRRPKSRRPLGGWLGWLMPPTSTVSEMPPPLAKPGASGEE
jgi:drug/metabolite transporter (DMT)-like permease